MQLTIGKRIIVGSTVAVLITAGLGLFAYLRFNAISERTQFLSQISLPDTAASLKLESLTRRNCVLALRHMVSGEKEKMKQIEADLQANRQQCGELLKQLEEHLRSEEG
ncbi:MAG: MCP four helix bundle domain-containing protein [Tepidisphaerales bacterium]